MKEKDYSLIERVHWQLRSTKQSTKPKSFAKYSALSAATSNLHRAGMVAMQVDGVIKVLGQDA